MRKSGHHGYYGLGTEVSMYLGPWHTVYMSSNKRMQPTRACGGGVDAGVRVEHGG